MNVIKKDGRIEPLDMDKLKTSIVNACNEPNSMALTDSDVNTIAKDVINIAKKIRNDTDNTSSYELTGIVKEVLLKGHYIDLMKCFVSFNPYK